MTIPSERAFRLLVLVSALASLCPPERCGGAEQPGTEMPFWLEAYRKTYASSPRQAAREWFRDAKFGLFVHLNLASLCENGKADHQLWVSGEAPDRLLAHVGVSREDYESAEDKDRLLFNHYRLAQFDAEAICRLAVQAEMKYITFTTLHRGRCFNFKTDTSSFNSVEAPCGRDLVAELASACKRHGLGLFLYLPPEYAQDDPTHRDDRLAVIEELLTRYGPIAGIWFDGISRFYSNPENFTRLPEMYDFIRSLQPHCLVSFKEGAVCDEDFITPEHFMLPFEYAWDTPGRQERWTIRKERWDRQSSKLWETCNRFMLREINTVMQECRNRDNRHVPSGWLNDESARHLTADEVAYWLTYARHTGSNLLLNIGPRADGSVHPDDRKALEEVGRRIRRDGWPPGGSIPPGANGPASVRIDAGNENSHDQ